MASSLDSCLTLHRALLHGAALTIYGGVVKRPACIEHFGSGDKLKQTGCGVVRKAVTPSSFPAFLEPHQDEWSHAEVVAATFHDDMLESKYTRTVTFVQTCWLRKAPGKHVHAAFLSPVTGSSHASTLVPISTPAEPLNGTAGDRCRIRICVGLHGGGNLLESPQYVSQCKPSSEPNPSAPATCTCAVLRTLSKAAPSAQGLVAGGS